tara:strand:- start:116 stop:364 length:249 start_codon:yes stop_codon:yes gene_type:complete
MNRKFKKIDGIEYEIITKKEWKEKGHTTQEGKKYIMRYDDKRGTILRPIIVEDTPKQKQFVLKNKKTNKIITMKDIFKMGEM